jgi:hypothetical protein
VSGIRGELGDRTPPRGRKLQADCALEIRIATKASAADRLAAAELTPAFELDSAAIALADPVRTAVFDACEGENLETAETATADIDDPGTEIHIVFAENPASIGSH